MSDTSAVYRVGDDELREDIASYSSECGNNTRWILQSFQPKLVMLMKLSHSLVIWLQLPWKLPSISSQASRTAITNPSGALSLADGSFSPFATFPMVLRALLWRNLSIQCVHESFSVILVQVVNHFFLVLHLSGINSPSLLVLKALTPTWRTSWLLLELTRTLSTCGFPALELRLVPMWVINHIAQLITRVRCSRGYGDL